MATVEQILTLARKELGYRESPANSNRTKYGKWYGLDGEPWCMMFVMWIFYQAEASDLPPVRTASCGEFMKAAKKAGNWYPRTDLKPGDVVIFDFPGNAAKTDHVGIVEALADEDEYVFTIEGNTSVSSDDDGGTVMRRKRKRSLIVGAFRPAYDEEREAPEVKAEAKPSAAAPIEDPETERMLYGEPQTAKASDEAPEAAKMSGTDKAPETETMRYDDRSPDDEPDTAPEVGELVMFTGKSQFSGPYDDAEAVPAGVCMARIDAYCPGAAHPFRLYGKGLEGWSDFDDVTAVSCEADDASCQEASKTLSLGDKAFFAEITVWPSLRVRSGPGLEYEAEYTLSGGTVVTIVREEKEWGELSAGGWIRLRYAKKL